jgi:hypothetical protein
MAKKKESGSATPAKERSYVVKEMPSAAKARKLNLPPLVRMKDVPIGTIISGKVKAVIENFTGKSELKGSHVLHLTAPDNETEFLFPATGVLRQALTRDSEGNKVEIKSFIGKTLFIKRTDNQMNDKYKKEMFMFDISVMD